MPPTADGDSGQRRLQARSGRPHRVRQPERPPMASAMAANCKGRRCTPPGSVPTFGHGPILRFEPPPPPGSVPTFGHGPTLRFEPPLKNCIAGGKRYSRGRVRMSELPPGSGKRYSRDRVRMSELTPGSGTDPRVRNVGTDPRVRSFVIVPLCVSARAPASSTATGTTASRQFH